MKFYVAFRGFKGSRRSIRVSDDEVQKLDERSLPVYTILIPIFREAQVLSHIIENVYKIDYPRDKLDLKILMEETDHETIEEAKKLGLFGKPETVLTPIMSLAQPKERSKKLKLRSSSKVIDPDAIVLGTLESIVEKASEMILNVRRKNGEILQIPSLSQSYVRLQLVNVMQEVQERDLQVVSDSHHTVTDRSSITLEWVELRLTIVLAVGARIDSLPVLAYRALRSIHQHLRRNLF